MSPVDQAYDDGYTDGYRALGFSPPPLWRLKQAYSEGFSEGRSDRDLEREDGHS